MVSAVCIHGNNTACGIVVPLVYSVLCVIKLLSVQLLPRELLGRIVGLACVIAEGVYVVYPCCTVSMVTVLYVQ